MVVATVRNTSPSMRAIPNIDRTMVNLKPGEQKTIDLHAHTAMLLEREAGKSRDDREPAVEIRISSTERPSYDDELSAIRGNNRSARTGARMLTRVTAIASKPRLQRVDPRFITDPKIVGDEPVPIAKQFDPDEAEPAPKKRASPREPGPAAFSSPADAAKKRRVAKRVPLKDKKG